MGIFWAGKLAGKERKSSEAGGKHVVLPTQIQFPVYKEKRGIWFPHCRG